MLPIVPFLIAFIIAKRGSHLPQTDVEWSAYAGIIGGGAVLWLVVAIIANASIARRRNHRLLIWWDIFAQGVCLGWLAWLCLNLGWAARLPGVMLALGPYFLMLGIHWATYAIGVRGVSRRPWTWRSMLLHQIRFSALPLVIGLGAIVDISEYWTVHTLGSVPPWLEWTGFAVLALFAYATMPFLLEKLWGCLPLPANPRTELLQAACARMGYPRIRLRRWPMPHARHHNAVVVGVLPGLRVVMLSDGLLADLSDEQLIAVIGHELGHTRHRHLLTYLLFFLTISSLASLGMTLGWFPDLDAVTNRPWSETGMAIVAGFIAIRMGFGWWSRKCERQADLAGAQLVGSPQVMAGALKVVARLSGEPEDARNWSHSSTGQRVAFMAAVAADPNQAHRHHRTMRYSLVILVVVMLLSLGLNLWLSPVSKALQNDNPQAALKIMADKDSDLANALVAADNGDPSPLAKWYQRTDRESRLAVAILFGKQGAGETDADLYRMRYRLIAISGIDSGDPGTNITLDNALAYTLVAGTATPTANDLLIAKRLLPNLERALLDKPENAIFDTVGCIHFRLGAWAPAIDAFQNALSQLDKETKPTDAERDQRRLLYQARLAAAKNNRTGEPLPLPLEAALKKAPAVQPPAPATAAPSTP